MGQRYARSSYSDEAMAATATDGRQLLQDGVTSGRNFYLRGIMITNTHASEGTILQLFDYNTEGAAPTATLQRGEIYVGPIDTVVLGFEAPGVKFATGVLGGLATAVGTIAAYAVTIWGYES